MIRARGKRSTARLDEEKIRPTSTTVDGAQSRQRLGKQAKAIMDDFIKALDKVGEISGEVGIERAEMSREAIQNKPESGFRERILKNAPKKDEGHIVTEKKSW